MPMASGATGGIYTPNSRYTEHNAIGSKNVQMTAALGKSSHTLGHVREMTKSRKASAAGVSV